MRGTGALNLYYLHEHISVCYMFLDEAFKDVSHNKHSDPLKLIVSENWQYTNCATAPQEIIDTFKYDSPTKRAYIKFNDPVEV